MDKDEIEHMSDKEIQNFFNEIEDLVNERQDDKDDGDGGDGDVYNVGVEKQLSKKGDELIEKKKNDNKLSVQSKIHLFLEEINFIKEVLDTYEKENKHNKNNNDKCKNNEMTEKSDDILKDVIYLELGLKESESTSDDFIIATKKSLDIRIEDFRRNEISESYFLKKINEIYTNTLNELDIEKNADDKKSNEYVVDKSKSTLLDDLSQNMLNVPLPVKDTVDTNYNEPPVYLISKNISTEGESDKYPEKKKKKKNRMEPKLESSNFLHKKKLKLVERWKKVAAETNLVEDSD
ncbi:conserved protein, unknown function [Hepatocystis sp. ex Piliocolobus tephrosceles]|nr:conserved protein, unknown function [Hepatocystis sp. ex Piliocolobus tephrosceles]